MIVIEFNFFWGGNGMKKIFVLVFMAAIIFAGTVCASAEPIKFPNGITVDVATGWSYEGEGDNIILIADDESCVIGIIVADPEGMKSGEEAAEALSNQHKGTKPEKINDGSWTGYDVSPQSCALSNGLVKQKDIVNIAAESSTSNFLVMMGCSIYFRSGHVYEACAAFTKVLIVDIALEEYPLSIATLDPSHYAYSVANFLQLARISGKSVELSHFAMVPHRMTVYLEHSKTA